MNLKKDFILTFFNHRLFALPAFSGLFCIQFSPLGELSCYMKIPPAIKLAGGRNFDHFSSSR